MAKKEESKKCSFNLKENYVGILIGIVIGIVLLIILEQIPAIGNFFTSGEIIAKGKRVRVTEESLYKTMKKSYPISYVLELVDKPILEKEYKLTKEQEEEINEKVETILQQYKGYGYTEEQFYEENGFSDKEDFVEYMKLDYRRNLYCIDYFKDQITDDKIQEYYNGNDIYGEISTKYMLVQINDNVTDAEALKTVNEIIKKLNNGASFDDVANEYADKVVKKDASFDSFDELTLDETYVEASKLLEPGTYTKEAVKTSYGYNVIYCVSKAEKPTLDQIKDDIINVLIEEIESEDQYIRYKILVKLREEYKVKFKDEKYQKEYEEYCEQIENL